MIYIDTQFNFVVKSSLTYKYKFPTLLYVRCNILPKKYQMRI